MIHLFTKYLLFIYNLHNLDIYAYLLILKILFIIIYVSYLEKRILLIK